MVLDMPAPVFHLPKRGEKRIRECRVVPGVGFPFFFFFPLPLANFPRDRMESGSLAGISVGLVGFFFLILLFLPIFRALPTSTFRHRTAIGWVLGCSESWRCCVDDAE